MAKNRYNKICQMCGAPFTTELKKQKNCSKGCRRAQQTNHWRDTRKNFMKYRNEVKQKIEDSLSPKTKAYMEILEICRIALIGSNKKYNPTKKLLAELILAEEKI